MKVRPWRILESPENQTKEIHYDRKQCGCGDLQSHPEAEAAIKELQQSGFDMKKLSIVGRDYHTDEHCVGYYTTGDRMKYWEAWSFLGLDLGMLIGFGSLFDSGVGPLLMAGPVVGWLLGALGEAVLVGGLSALVPACKPRHSEEQRPEVRDAVKSGKFVIIAHGTALDATRAETSSVARTGAVEHMTIAVC